MYNLLSKKENRYLNLLELLIYNETWTTIPFLAEKLHCSPQCLGNDIREINHFMTPFEIETSQKKGIRLNTPTHSSIDLLYKRLLENSTEYKLIELVLFDESMTSETLADVLYISTSTLFRILGRIKKKLSTNGFDIESNPYKLVGDEISIRHFYTNYFMECYPEGIFPFTQDEITIVNSLVRELLIILNVTPNYFQTEQLKLHTLVSLTRIKNKHESPSIQLTSPYLKKSISELYQINPLLNQVKSIFGINDHISVLEEVFTVLDKKYLPLSHIQVDSKNIQNEILFIEDLKDIYHIKESYPKDLAQDIYRFNNNFIENNYVIYNKTKIFVEQVKKKYPHYMNQLEIYLESSNLYKNMSISSDFKYEISYLLITGWPNLIQILTQNMKKVRIGVFGGSTKHTTEFIANMIDYHFSEHVSISTINSIDLLDLQEDIRNIDLLLTTFPYIESLPIDYIVISLSPSNKEFNEIQEKIFKLTAKVNFKLS